jgi:hypothetical protein
VYGRAHDRLQRSLPDRAAFEAEVSLPGVSRLHVTADDGARLWLVEDELQGTLPSPARVGQWFPEASAWLVRLAGPPGPPLGSTRFWEEHQPEAVGGAPPEVQASVVQAWEALAEVPARSLHGDVQPQNLVLGDHGVGLIDWEGFWRHGLPGLDLVFLALMSDPTPPDATVVEALADGREPEGRPLRSALAEAGLPTPLLETGLVAMLSTWALGERRRIERSRRAPREAPFRDLLSSYAPRLQKG